MNPTAAGLALMGFGESAGMASALLGIVVYGGGSIASMAMGAFNATSPVRPQAIKAMTDVLGMVGNPSSVHGAGRAARALLEKARTDVAALIGGPASTVVFTSGGTEANGLAIESAVAAGARRLIISAIEHDSVIEAAKASGMAIEVLPVDRHGMADLSWLQARLADWNAEEGTPFVALMAANNETGVVQPVASIARLVAEAKVYSHAAPGSRPSSARVWLHLDASQAVGKLPVSLGGLAADLLTVSAHKFHGLKGAGALYVRTGVKPKPQIMGGPQERDRRAGTENTYGIIGMGTAAAHVQDFLEDALAVKTQRSLRDRFEAKVVEALPDTVVHSVGGADLAPAECVDPLYSPDGRVWNTTNLGFPRLEAEAILLGLSEKGVCVSAGAACSSGSLEPSPVLLAMGIPPIVAHGSVRFSLSRYSTIDEVDEAARQVEHVVRRLRKTV